MEAAEGVSLGGRVEASVTEFALLGVSRNEAGEGVVGGNGGRQWDHES